MSDVKQHILRAQNALKIGKKVLFVEGKTDSFIYSKWLAKHDPLYAARLELIETGGRNDLDTALVLLNNSIYAFALRDRDEADEDWYVKSQILIPNLLVNMGRHCLESYFCDPEEILAILMRKDSTQFASLENILRTAIIKPLSDWVDHWAMWTTAMRLQRNMVSEGYASYFHKTIPLPNDIEIQQRLDTWSNLADKKNTWTSFSNLRAKAQGSQAKDQFQSFVHGKLFWERVILPELQKAEKHRDWLIDLAEWSDVPFDLRPILNIILP